VHAKLLIEAAEEDRSPGGRSKQERLVGTGGRVKKGKEREPGSGGKSWSAGHGKYGREAKAAFERRYLTEE
jgi:hypothetical protein